MAEKANEAELGGIKPKEVKPFHFLTSVSFFLTSSPLLTDRSFMNYGGVYQRLRHPNPQKELEIATIKRANIPRK